jgi:hypothetical protein
VKETNCLIGATCYSAGAGQPGNSCAKCDPPASKTTWSALPNGTGCNVDGDLCTQDTCQSGSCTVGPLKDCDDGIACTTDSCVEGIGVCSNPIPQGTCVIAGECYLAGTLNPGNSCQECKPLVDVGAWVNKSTGLSCDDGNLCTVGEKCTSGVCGGGEAVECDGGAACNPATGCP